MVQEKKLALLLVFLLHHFSNLNPFYLSKNANAYSKVDRCNIVENYPRADLVDIESTLDTALNSSGLIASQGRKLYFFIRDGHKETQRFEVVWRNHGHHSPNQACKYFLVGWKKNQFGKVISSPLLEGTKEAWGKYLIQPSEIIFKKDEICKGFNSGDNPIINSKENILLINRFIKSSSDKEKNRPAFLNGNQVHFHILEDSFRDNFPSYSMSKVVLNELTRKINAFYLNRDYRVRVGEVYFIPRGAKNPKTHIISMNKYPKGQYMLLNKIGSGGYKEVYAAMDVFTGTPVALLIDKKKNRTNPDLKNFLSIVDRENLSGIAKIKYWVHSRRRDKFFYAQELYESDLFTLIKDNKITSTKKAFYTHSLINALENIHRHFYVHKDIKPENISIDKKGEALINDFDMVTPSSFKVKGTLGFFNPMLYHDLVVHQKDRFASFDDMVRNDRYAMGLTLGFMFWPDLMKGFTLINHEIRRRGKNKKNENWSLLKKRIVEMLSDIDISEKDPERSLKTKVLALMYEGIKADIPLKHRKELFLGRKPTHSEALIKSPRFAIPNQL